MTITSVSAVQHTRATSPMTWRDAGECGEEGEREALLSKRGTRMTGEILQCYALRNRTA
ncbi:hypothetical protein [Pandoraea horticolens]|uniref:hypothetical protein n=1 Tax=Pandoraea horticolens TaxID=2508298 RepID=UPI001582D3E1|nr:hypothetical protein [Pandoraea horticolens]